MRCGNKCIRVDVESDKCVYLPTIGPKELIFVFLAYWLPYWICMFINANNFSHFRTLYSIETPATTLRCAKAKALKSNPLKNIYFVTRQMSYTSKYTRETLNLFTGYSLIDSRRLCKINQQPERIYRCYRVITALEMNDSRERHCSLAKIESIESQGHTPCMQLRCMKFRVSMFNHLSDMTKMALYWILITFCFFILNLIVAS